MQTSSPLGFPTATRSSLTKFPAPDSDTLPVQQTSAQAPNRRGLAASGSQPASGTAKRSSLSHSFGFWVAGLAFLLNMAFCAVPTPLYAIYAKQEGFSTFVITMIYAAFAGGVVLSLFLGGHLSDWYGRKNLLIGALLINVVSGLVFIFEPSLAGLIVARVISGISIGLTTATATAYISELQALSLSTSVKRAGIIAAAANLGGIGVGPLVSGALAEFAPEPLRLPYIVVGSALVVLAVLLTFAPETRSVPAVDRPPYRPQRVVLPKNAMRVFFAATTIALAINAIMGIFTSLAPTFLLTVMNEPSRWIAGVVVFAAFGSAAVAPILAASWTVSMMLQRSLPILALGLGLFVTGIFLSSTPLFLVGGVVTGGAAGLGFRAALGIVAANAPVATRAEVLSGFFLGGYVGLSVPVVGLGVATQLLPREWSVLGFVILALAAATVAAVIARKAMRPAEPRGSRLDTSTSR